MKQSKTFLRKKDFLGLVELTAIIRKGEKQYVALCPELDVVSQGTTIDASLKNLQEACELYVEEIGFPEGMTKQQVILASFEVKDEAAKTIRT